jgi:hypothetical protein
MSPPAAAPPPQPQHPIAVADVVHVDTSESEDMYMLLPHPRQTREDQPRREGLDSPELPPANRRRNPVRANRRPRFEAAAADDDDDSSHCIESDTDAQRLYRDDILGLRSARNARSQLRSDSASCPACALFAAFKRHFL